MGSFQKLRVWQLAKELAVNIYLYANKAYPGKSREQITSVHTSRKPRTAYRKPIEIIPTGFSSIYEINYLWFSQLIKL